MSPGVDGAAPGRSQKHYCPEGQHLLTMCECVLTVSGALMQDLLPEVPILDSFSAAVALDKPLLPQQGFLQEEPSSCQNISKEQDTLMLFALPATVLEAATPGRPARYAN